MSPGPGPGPGPGCRLQAAGCRDQGRQLLQASSGGPCARGPHFRILDVLLPQPGKPVLPLVCPISSGTQVCLPAMPPLPSPSPPPSAFLSVPTSICRSNPGPKPPQPGAWATPGPLSGPAISCISCVPLLHHPHPTGVAWSSHTDFAWTGSLSKRWLQLQTPLLKRLSLAAPSSVPLMIGTKEHSQGLVNSDGRDCDILTV